VSHFQSVEEKLIVPELLEASTLQLRSLGKTIATLNGSFDLLHAGHLYMLSEAAKQADILIVALNSDLSIKKYKSPDRPIITLEHRLQLIAALEMVDWVTWFDETDPCELLRKIRPDVHVNGAEYGEDCIEASTVKEVGARLHLVKRIPLLSSSDIIGRINALK
jgi:D-glycero-beta-D-manno-heptose 1-phosphate adenylyltransferase